MCETIVLCLHIMGLLLHQHLDKIYSYQLYKLASTATIPIILKKSLIKKTEKCRDDS